MADGSGEFDLRSLPKMVRWYSPAHLVSTGWRSVVSEIFGQYADQRIMQATIDGFAPEIMKTVIGRYNYSDLRHLGGDGDTVWVDYIADLGDGFDSTYAMASLVSQPQIDLPGVGSLPAAKLLIMGGDQVYPFPTRQAYRERMAMPYATALPAAPDGSWRRLLFVLPGNHDWYDGLSSFDHMFCKARFGHAVENRIGGWMCPQHRSYFAIRLPHNWWIWGADIQLAQYLDAGQILYFEGVAEAMKAHPTEAPKVILCTPEPSWNYDKDESLQGEDNLSTITKIAGDAGARIAAVVAGDLHHYSRYQSKETGTQFYTAGGGGAYFSPTHYLKDKRKVAWGDKRLDLDLKCQIKDGQPTGKPSAWPSRGESRRLSLWTLAFPFHNYGYAVALGVIYWVMIWMFSTTPYSGSTVGETLIKDPEFHWWPGLFLLAPLAAATNVILGIWCLALWVVLYGYADGARGTKVKLLLGTLHWVAHIAMMIALYYAVSYFSFYLVDTVWPQAKEMLQNLQLKSSSDVRELFRAIVIFPLVMIFIGGVAAGFVWGAYLTISCLFGMHCDQAFASMGIPDYKNFLRMKVEPNKLTIYSIGLKRTPRRWAWRQAKDTGLGAGTGPAIVPARPLRPTIIDGPVEIRVGDLKRPEPRRKNSVA